MLPMTQRNINVPKTRPQKVALVASFPRSSDTSRFSVRRTAHR